MPFGQAGNVNQTASDALKRYGVFSGSGLTGAQNALADGQLRFQIATANLQTLTGQF